MNFIVFRLDFDDNLSEFQEIAAKYCEILIFQKRIRRGVASDEKPSQDCDMESQAYNSEESNKNSR